MQGTNRQCTPTTPSDSRDDDGVALDSDRDSFESVGRRSADAGAVRLSKPGVVGRACDHPVARWTDLCSAVWARGAECTEFARFGLSNEDSQGRSGAFSAPR